MPEGTQKTAGERSTRRPLGGISPEERESSPRKGSTAKKSQAGSPWELAHASVVSPWGGEQVPLTCPYSQHLCLYGNRR